MIHIKHWMRIYNDGSPKAGFVWHNLATNRDGDALCGKHCPSAFPGLSHSFDQIPLTDLVCDACRTISRVDRRQKEGEHHG